MFEFPAAPIVAPLENERFVEFKILFPERSLKNNVPAEEILATVPICSGPPGAVVPIPTFPCESTIKLVAVLDPTTNAASPA
jgi:hypothetical protein